LTIKPILIPTFVFLIFTDSFVNSQEWTLSRSVPDLRLGIVGSLSSGKSALVHRYLTGSYMQEESPEGGRFKKEISVDGHSHLLLIRDEGGSPESQVSLYTYIFIIILRRLLSQRIRLHWSVVVMHILLFKRWTMYKKIYSIGNDYLLVYLIIIFIL